MSLASRVTNAPRDMLRCAVIALDTKTGERKSMEIWCKSFYEVYGKLRRQGLRLVSYTIL